MKEAGCGAVIGHVERVSFDGDRATPQQVAQIGRRTPGYTPGALMIRRSAFDAVGRFDEALSIGADSDWFVRLAQSPVRLDVVPEVVLHKGARADSLSTDLATYRRELLAVGRRFIAARRRSKP
jgi:hypothetical protein